MTSKLETKLINRIANGARAMSADAGHEWRKDHAFMDIAACHEKCPLRLNALLQADDFNFAHDVFGINRHLNRETYELEDCFVPRYAAPEGGEAA